MTDFTAEPGHIAGFGLDMTAIADSFWPRARREIESMILQDNTAGPLSTLIDSVRKFGEDAWQSCSASQAELASFGTELANASRQISRQDEQSADDLAVILTDGITRKDAEATHAVVHYPAQQFPTPPEVELEPHRIRQVVDWAAALLEPFDTDLGRVAGIEPAAQYLRPLAADWEQLQTLGRRIRVLSASDFSISANVEGGLNWLAAHWTGTSAHAFRESAGSFAQDIGERGERLQWVSNTLERGGECICLLAYNQAVGLTTDLLRPTEFLGLNLPLGVWGRILDNPLRDSIRNEILASIFRTETHAKARSDQISAVLSDLRNALRFDSRQVPAINDAIFDPPSRLAEPLGAIRYGYGDNVWWEERIEIPR